MKVGVMTDETRLGVLVSPLGEGNGTTDAIYACTVCGAAVVDLPAHVAWHERRKA